MGHRRAGGSGGASSSICVGKLSDSSRSLFRVDSCRQDGLAYLSHGLHILSNLRVPERLLSNVAPFQSS